MLTIQSTGQYTVSVSSDWIVHKGSSEKNKELFFIKANYSEARIDTIVIMCGDASAQFVVKQESGLIADLGVERTAKALASKIYAGVNIGNVVEEEFLEGATAEDGNTILEKSILGLRDAGFNAVRIQCAWSSHIEDMSTYKIESKWLLKVQEIVDMIVDNGMYAILNIYEGDEDEDNCTADKMEENNQKLKTIWTQIADMYKSYDEKLLLACCHEPKVSTQDEMAVLASYEQTFVDAVRATGERNAKRVLVVPGPMTDIQTTDMLMNLPTDEIKDRLMVEVQFFSLYSFCAMTQDEDDAKVSYFWGSVRKDVPAAVKDRNASDVVDAEGVNTLFLKMKKKYANQGIPVVLGKYGAYYRREETVGAEYYALHKASVDEWLYKTTQLAKTNGMIPFMWEAGTLVSRENGAVTGLSQVNNIKRGAIEGVYPSNYK